MNQELQLLVAVLTLTAAGIGLLAAVLRRKKRIEHVYREEYGPPLPGCGLRLFWIIRNGIVGAIIGAVIAFAVAAGNAVEQPEVAAPFGAAAGGIIGFISGMFVNPNK